MVKVLYILHLRSWASWWCRRFHQSEWRGMKDRLRPGQVYYTDDLMSSGTVKWACWKCGRAWLGGDEG